MFKLNRHEKEVHFQICNRCIKHIYGRTYYYKDNYVIIAKNKIVGICVNTDWIEYYNCLDCFNSKEDI